MQDSSTSSSAIWVAWHVLSTLPKRLWDAYITQLLFYRPQSLVGRLASTFRVLAVILILPVVLLTLLDVTSYVIVRTLGVVDDVKASTSDADADRAANPHTCACISERHRTVCTCPAQRGVGVDIDVDVGVGVPVRMSDRLPSRDSVRRTNDKDKDDAGHGHEHGDIDEHGCAKTDVGTLITHVCVGDPAIRHIQSLDSDSKSGKQYRNQNRHGSEKGSEMWSSADRSEDRVHACYFAGEDALRLAGEGVFSPAVSGPPSPVTPRTPLYAFAPDTLGDTERNALRRRV